MGTRWNVFTNNFDLTSDISDAVIGPVSSTDNAVARFDGTSGVLLEDSGVLISDGDAITGASSVALDLGATIDEFSIDGTLAGNSDTALPTEKAVKTYVDASHPSVSLPDAVMGGSARTHSLNTTTAFAPITYVDLGTVEIYVRAFNTSTEEYMQKSFRVPDDIDTSGTVTFEVQGWSSTAAASKNVAFTFGYRSVAAGEAIDGSYTDVDADDQAVDATQDKLDIITWTETVATLGWVAGDMIPYRFSRFAATTNNLATDYYVYNFYIRVPRA